MAKAVGKHAYGICDISGFRYPLKDMKRTWDGLLVGPDQWNAKHPQLEPRRHVTDAEALSNPRPDQDADGGKGYVVITANLITQNFSMINDSLPKLFEVGRSVGSVGDVTITTDVPANRATPDGLSATASLGTISVTGTTVNETLTGQAATSGLGTPTVTTSSLTTYTVTVASGTNSYGSGNKYYLDGSVSPTINLSEGSTYRFDQSDSSNSGHPLRFSTTANGTHGGGYEYTTGVTTNGTPGSSGAYTQITVASGAPTLYYYCTNHSGMGGQANTP